MTTLHQGILTGATDAELAGAIRNCGEFFSEAFPGRLKPRQHKIVIHLLDRLGQIAGELERRELYELRTQINSPGVADGP